MVGSWGVGVAKVPAQIARGGGLSRATERAAPTDGRSDLAVSYGRGNPSESACLTASAAASVTLDLRTE